MRLWKQRVFLNAIYFALWICWRCTGKNGGVIVSICWRIWVELFLCALIALTSSFHSSSESYTPRVCIRQRCHIEFVCLCLLIVWWNTYEKGAVLLCCHRWCHAVVAPAVCDIFSLREWKSRFDLGLDNSHFELTFFTFGMIQREKDANIIFNLSSQFIIHYQ